VEEILSSILRHIQQKNNRSVQKVVKVSVAVHGLRSMLSATVQREQLVLIKFGVKSE